jgi:hypothetical protein
MDICFSWANRSFLKRLLIAKKKVLFLTAMSFWMASLGRSLSRLVDAARAMPKAMSNPIRKFVDRWLCFSLQLRRRGQCRHESSTA